MHEIVDWLSGIRGYVYEKNCWMPVHTLPWGALPSRYSMVVLPVISLFLGTLFPLSPMWHLCWLSAPLCSQRWTNICSVRSSAWSTRQTSAAVSRPATSTTTSTCASSHMSKLPLAPRLYHKLCFKYLARSGSSIRSTSVQALVASRLLRAPGLPRILAQAGDLFLANDLRLASRAWRRLSSTRTSAVGSVSQLLIKWSGLWQQPRHMGRWSRYPAAFPRCGMGTCRRPRRRGCQQPTPRWCSCCCQAQEVRKS